MIDSKLSYKAKEIAPVIGYSPRSIHRRRAYVRNFGSTKAPRNRVRRPRRIAPIILNALCEHLLDKPIYNRTRWCSF
jgi:hypothetical protein